jgi:hypothetical protein
MGGFKKVCLFRDNVNFGLVLVIRLNNHNLKYNYILYTKIMVSYKLLLGNSLYETNATCPYIIINTFEFTTQIDTFITENTIFLTDISGHLGCLGIFNNTTSDLLVYFHQQVTTLFPSIIGIDILDDWYKRDLMTFNDSIHFNVNGLTYFNHSITFLKHYRPLIFPIKPNCTNLMLISDNDLNYNNKQTFYNAANETTLPVIYYSTTLRSELTALIQANPTLNKMCIVTHNACMNNKLFIEKEPFFTENDISPTTTDYSANLKFMLDNASTIKQIDFLACNSLSYSNWQAYYALLLAKGGLKIGASNDFTGNISSGGDWIMESTQQDIQTVYFNDSIENYQGTLSIDTVEIIDETNAIVNLLVPVTIVNWTYELDVSDISSNGVVITNTTPLRQVYISLKNTGTYNNYPIIIDSNNITIDGKNTPLPITTTTPFDGIIKVNDNLQHIKIRNIDATITSTSTLNTSSGWICHGEMNNTQVQFDNCNVTSADGITIGSNAAGGICGGENGSNNATGTTNLTFTDCNVTSLTGNINIGDYVGSDYADGICGGGNGSNNATDGTATLTFITCNVTASDGNIIIGSFGGGATGSGGICGGRNGSYNTTDGTANLTFTTCNVTASNGNIRLNDLVAGGICCGGNGSSNGNDGTANLTFTDCNVTASTGNINIGISTVNRSGGICGGENGTRNVNGTGTATLTFTTCNVIASTGNITIGEVAGGICGGENGSYNTTNDGTATLTFTDCNVTASTGGIIINASAGGICGGYNGSFNATGTATLTFTTCNVTASTGNISIGNNIGDVAGGICGGYNGSFNATGTATLTFTTCNVTASNGDITIGDGAGGICGGYNGSGNNNGTGTVNLSFTTCNVTASADGITIGINAGGICGGGNGSNNATDGITNLTFTDCNVTASNGDITRGSSAGGICGGNNGTQNGNDGTANLTFTDCNVTASTGDIFINDFYAGGICGGRNGSDNINGTGTANLTFTTCNVTASNGDITIGGYTAGGICGGENGNANGTGTATLTFTDCNVTASTGNITIGNNVGDVSAGGICGGQNGYLNNNGTGTANLTFTTCNVTASTGDITISGDSAGGICGGNNGSRNINGTGTTNLTFTTCNVTASTGNITIGNNVGGDSAGGICGGGNGSVNNNDGTANLTFTTCNVTASDGGISITGIASGGICGGDNGILNTTGTATLTFTTCFLYWCESFSPLLTSDPTYFYNLQEKNAALIIVGDGNVVSALIVIDYASAIIQQCPPPPPPPPPPPLPQPDLGGGLPGFQLQLLHLMEGGNERAMDRKVLRSAFPTQQEAGCSPFNVSINNCKKVIYSCGSKKLGSSSASERTKFLKLKAINQNYNDKSFGGSNNASFTAINTNHIQGRSRTQKRSVVINNNSIKSKTISRRYKGNPGSP